MRLDEQLARVLAAEGIGPAQPVLVACSAGPDSTALAHAVLALSARGRLGPVTLVYIDHRLRPQAGSEGEQVRALAAAYGGSARVVPVEVDRETSSLERAAREARYAALDRVAAELDAPVLLGHTASDQAETVLMRVISGTGIAGLAGIPARRGRYLRPLLEVSRREVDRYVAAHRLAPAADAMNEDPRFCRTRMRHRWLPALREENPRVEEALCRLADAAREQRELLEHAAGVLLEQAGGGGAPNALRVDALAAAPPAATKRALARAAERAGSRPLAAAHLEALLELVHRPAGGTAELDLPGLRAVREYGCLHLGAPAVGVPAQVVVEGPDAPYEVRQWRAGDRMRPSRLRGRSRKLSDLYTDAKLPRRLRERALVAVRRRDGAVVWAQHLGSAHGAGVKVTLTGSTGPATKEY